MNERYFIFAGSNFYPLGGMNDFIGSWNNVSAAIVGAKANIKKIENDWAHVWDSEERVIIWDSTKVL
jgi:hypothetical protein